MTLSAISLENIVLALCSEIKKKSKKTKAKRCTEKELWENLATSILSSQVPYEIAVQFGKKLKQEKLLLPPGNKEEPATYYIQVLNILQNGIDIDGRVKKYRFPESKAKQITRSRLDIISMGCELQEVVYANECPLEIRKHMVSLVCGFGPKQASMYLRDAGASNNLAIIDTHVLDYMKFMGLLKDKSSLPTSTKAYDIVEQSLLKYADYMGASIGMLDRAIWQTMRIAKKAAYI